MHSLAIARFELPGEAGFPLNAMYTKPADGKEEETMRRCDYFEFDLWSWSESFLAIDSCQLDLVMSESLDL